jgi:hypothetical protein
MRKFRLVLLASFSVLAAAGCVGVVGVEHPVVVREYREYPVVVEERPVVVVHPRPVVVVRPHHHHH